MDSLTGFKTYFTKQMFMSFIVMLLFLGCIKLGFWQIERGFEKQNMLKASKAFSHQTPHLWDSTHRMPQQYQPVLLEGQWMQPIILLDNQFHEHRFGYHVFSPLLLKDGKVILVDRGWILGDITRQVLPSISVVKGFQRVSGSVYYPSQKHWVLGALIEKEKANLLVVEKMDVKVVSQFLHKFVYPFIIRIGEKEPHAYLREWPVVSMSPKRHYAYALQWFGLALVLLIGYICFRKKK